MADMAFLKLVLDNLTSLIKEEIGLIMGVDKEMNKLSSNLTAIQAILADAEVKQFESRSIRDWLCKLTDVAYEIDDILDECATHFSMAKHNNNILHRCRLKKILFHHNIGKTMKEVCVKLDVINAERTNFYLREMDVPSQDDLARVRETGSILNDSHHIFGRDEEKDKIVDILVNHVKNHKKLSVLPIIGVGGLGKTTLAQLVFNDDRIVEHFEKRIWVCVSNNFDLKTLLKKILESTTKSASASALQHLDTLQYLLQESLKKKKILLLLDDVWNDDQEKWFELKNVLACGLKGSSIIVTTRLKMVAGIMGTLPEHCLTGLSDYDCWLLFKERAFGQEKEENPNLVAIGKQIVKKCGGVPLAAKTLGGLLRFKREEKEWVCVRESELWDLKETSILPALRLSYHNLPIELRSCFTYCTVFPKDTRIDKDELILSWMAHGYISSSGTLEAEDVGNDIWKKLALRSLFQDVRMDDYGKTTFTLHDLVHDLAQSIRENRFLGTQVAIDSRSTSNSRLRQLNLKDDHMTLSPDLSPVLTKFNCLRMLNASQNDLQYVPSSIDNMKHLRYLNLSGTYIRSLPNTICTLWNLQTLVLDNCAMLEILPKHMRKLKNLSYLLLGDCESLIHMPPKMGEMTSLKRLSQFTVGMRKGSQLGELQYLSLGGKLHIDHLERVKNHVDAKKANLSRKQNLHHLCLLWKFVEESTSHKNIDQEKVLEALQPHSNLKHLEIFGYEGMHFPFWMRKSTLENVVKISIRRCANCSRLPRLGELPHLKFLELKWLEVKYITDHESQSGSFPSLEELYLINLPNLIGFSRKKVGSMFFPSLLRLKVEECPLLTLPPLPSLEEVLKAENCSSLTLSSFSKLENVTLLVLKFDNYMTYISTETPNIILTDHVELSEMKKGHNKLYALEEALRGLKSLATLKIYSFQKLTSLPGRGLRNLTALETLEIRSCTQLKELPKEIKYLHSLKHLDLSYCYKLKCLPEALQNVTSLQSLNLENLPLLTALPYWLGKLTSLQKLTITNCLKITSLPVAIKGMKNLQSLTIHCGACPELERRCEKGIGEDWHKIKNIPHLDVRVGTLRI